MPNIGWTLHKLFFFEPALIEWQVRKQPEAVESVFFDLSAVELSPSPMVRSMEVLATVGAMCGSTATASASCAPHAASIDAWLLKQTKVSKLALIAGILFVFFLPSAVLGSNPFGVLLGFISGVVAFRAWFWRRSFRIIKKRGSTENFGTRIYLPSFWAFTWRVFFSFLIVTTPLAFIAESAEGVGQTVGAMAVMWFSAVFALDVPLWARSSFRKQINGSAPNTSALPASLPRPI